MFFGVMGAANQFRFKSILAFHIISQLGYILLAISLPKPEAIIGAIFFIIHNIFVKTHLFMVAGKLQQLTGTDDFKKLGHMLGQHPWLAASFFLSAMSLAGFPPLSGFWGKFLILRTALLGNYYTATIVAIIVSLLTLYSMSKIWRYVFSEPAHVPQKTKTEPLFSSYSYIMATVPVVALPIFIGIYPDYILSILQSIKTQLTNPQHYILMLGGHSL